jgi:hypothetical protein
MMRVRYRIETDESVEAKDFMCPHLISWLFAPLFHVKYCLLDSCVFRCFLPYSAQMAALGTTTDFLVERTVALLDLPFEFVEDVLPETIVAPALFPAPVVLLCSVKSERWLVKVPSVTSVASSSRCRFIEFIVFAISNS